MKYLSFIAVLLLLFSPVAAQSCGDAAVQALPLLEGARSLIEAGNSQGAVALIESAEDLLRNCTTEEPSKSCKSHQPPKHRRLHPRLSVGIGSIPPLLTPHKGLPL
jgi:hypothetical protein